MPTSSTAAAGKVTRIVSFFPSTLNERSMLTGPAKGFVFSSSIMNRRERDPFLSSTGAGGPRAAMDRGDALNANALLVSTPPRPRGVSPRLPYEISDGVASVVSFEAFLDAFDACGVVVARFEERFDDFEELSQVVAFVALHRGEESLRFEYGVPFECAGAFGAFDASHFEDGAFLAQARGHAVAHEHFGRADGGFREEFEECGFECFPVSLGVGSETFEENAGLNAPCRFASVASQPKRGHAAFARDAYVERNERVGFGAVQKGDDGVAPPDAFDALLGPYGEVTGRLDHFGHFVDTDDGVWSVVRSGEENAHAGAIVRTVKRPCILAAD